MPAVRGLGCAGCGNGDPNASGVLARGRADGAGPGGVNGVALPPPLYEAPAALGSVCCWRLRGQEQKRPTEPPLTPARAQVSESILCIL